MVLRSRALLGLLVVGALAGCNGGEAPTVGDNPNSANAVSSQTAPQASRRNSTAPGRAAQGRPSAPTGGMKGL